VWAYGEKENTVNQQNIMPKCLSMKIVYETERMIVYVQDEVIR